MERRLRLRWWIEAVLFVVALGLFVVTVAWPEWIEAVFGVEPYGGSGAVEWLIAIGALHNGMRGRVVVSEGSA